MIPRTDKQVSAVPENCVTGPEVIASPHARTAHVPIYGDWGVGKPGTNGSNMVAIDVASRKVSIELEDGTAIIDPKPSRPSGQSPRPEGVPYVHHQRR